MKAVRVYRFGGPEVLTIEEVPDPVPGPGQIVVAVRAVGVNPVETYVRAGIYGDRAFPYTPGSDAAGVIEAVGDGVKHCEPGLRVYVYGSVTGTYAEKALCDQASVHPLAEGVTFQQGAAIGVPALTAHRALFGRGQAKTDDAVLVHGATGGVGTMAVQMAVVAGCTVIGTGGSADGRRMVKELGAHHVLDHHAAGYLDELMRITGGLGVDLIIELAAHINLGKDLTVLAPAGRVVVVGSRGPVEIDPRETMRRDADIRGMTLFNVKPEELKTMHQAIGQALEAGTLRPVVGDQLPLADVVRAHEVVMENESRGKVVMVVGEGEKRG